MNKRSKRYTDEFKMLILELLEEGRTKKSLENEYGVATATIRKWEKEYVHNENFENLESLRSGMYEYIEIWYNNSKIHSKIGFTSLNEYEEGIRKGNEEIA